MLDRRTHKRLEKKYRIEYGPLTALMHPEELKSSTLVNLSAEGVQFTGDVSFPAGTQLFVKIYVTGWSDEQGEIVPVDDQHAEVLLKTIAEVLRVDFDSTNKKYLVAAKLLGRVTADNAE